MSRASPDRLLFSGTVHSAGAAAKGGGIPALVKTPRLTPCGAASGGSFHDIWKHVFTFPEGQLCRQVSGFVAHPIEDEMPGVAKVAGVLPIQSYVMGCLYFYY
jgi:hypothetical protein